MHKTVIGSFEDVVGGTAIALDSGKDLFSIAYSENVVSV